MSDVTVKFGATDTGVEVTIEKIKGSMVKLDAETKKTSKSFIGGFKDMVVAGAGLATGMAALNAVFDAVKGVANEFGAAIDLGGRLTDLKSRTGETAGNLLILERAFDNTSVGADKVGGSINKMQKFIAAASVGSKEQSEVMARLGISMDELKGKTPTEQMAVFANRISGISDPTEKAAEAMKVFGKSGGELLPILTNFAGEISQAKDQLGSMPAVMNKSSAIFDNIGDSFAAVKTKVLEFAAGLLEKVAPAINFVVDALSRFDAAGFGERLGAAIVGGTSAMEGFAAATRAIGAGDFSAAFQIAFKSIILQAKQTANEIYRDMIAAFKASVDFIYNVLGPGSSIYTILKASFRILGDEISLGIAGPLKSILGSIPYMGDEIASNIDDNVKLIEKSIQQSKNQISNAAEEIGNDFARAGKAFPDSFKSYYSKTKPLFDVEQDILKLKDLSKQYAKEQAEASNGNIEAVDKAAKLEAEKSEAIKREKQKSLDLEIAITQAKADGNKPLEIQLESQKVYNKILKESLDAGRSIEDAQKQAAQAAQNYIQQRQNAEDQAHQKRMSQIKEEQSEYQKVLTDISNAMKKDDITGGGKLDKKVQDQLANRDFSGAQETARKINQREQEQNLRGFGNNRDNRNIKDIAKEEGIDSFRKSDQDLRDEIIAKRQKEMDPSNKGMTNKEKRERDAQDNKPDAKEDPLTSIQKAVETIKDLVKKIEPKLPQTALGI